MPKISFTSSVTTLLASQVLLLAVALCPAAAGDSARPQEPPPVPVRVATVVLDSVSEQISLVGSTHALAESTVAAEVSGIVEHYFVKEGDFVERGQPLAQLKSVDLKLRLQGARAARDQIQVKLDHAAKELKRHNHLKETNSIAERHFDEALFAHRGLSKALAQSEAQIERLKYEIDQKEVVAPFSGFVSREHTQIGEWITPGGAVATLIDLSRVLIWVDVPERYAVAVCRSCRPRVVIKSLSDGMIPGDLYAVLPRGNPTARTIAFKVKIGNSGRRIKSGMEATVIFDLDRSQNVLLVPKDAIVTQGTNRLVFAVRDEKALPVGVTVQGYFGNNVAVEGRLTPGDLSLIHI